MLVKRSPDLFNSVFDHRLTCRCDIGIKLDKW